MLNQIRFGQVLICKRQYTKFMCQLFVMHFAQKRTNILLILKAW